MLGFLGGDGAAVHQLLHVGVVVGELGESAVPDEVGPGVACVADKGVAAAHQCAHSRGAHARQLLLPGGFLEDEAVGADERPLQKGFLVAGQALGVLLMEAVLDDVAGAHGSLTASPRTAHAVAHHSHDIAAGQLGKTKGILIFPAHQAGIGDLPMLHAESPPFLSSIARRRSWPREASMSPPRLRRTVAVMPCDSNRF